MLITMVFAKNAHQHVRLAMDQDHSNVFNVSMDFINLEAVIIALNAQQVVLNAIDKVNAQNAMIIIIKVQMEIASDVMNLAENVKETPIIALLAELDITFMAKNADHAIQIVKNVKAQGIFAQNVKKVNSLMIGNSVFHVQKTARNALVLLRKNAKNVLMVIA